MGRLFREAADTEQWLDRSRYRKARPHVLACGQKSLCPIPGASNQCNTVSHCSTAQQHNPYEVNTFGGCLPVLDMRLDYCLPTCLSLPL